VGGGGGGAGVTLTVASPVTAGWSAGGDCADALAKVKKGTVATSETGHHLRIRNGWVIFCSPAVSAIDQQNRSISLAGSSEDMITQIILSTINM
jgi:hypothetical protein